MTILDDRVGIARLGPTPLSLLRDAFDRAEGDLDGLKWDIWDEADADTFKGAIKGRRGFTAEQTRAHIANDLNIQGADLHDAVLAVLRKLADDMEGELLRLNAR